MKNIKNKHQKIILSSMFAFMAASFFNPSGASALEDSPLIKYLNSDSTSTSSILNYDPWRPFASLAGCDSSNPDSTISCNEGPTSELSFNKYDGSLWENDGEGIIFTNTDKIIDDNPQLRTAKRGDTVEYSLKIHTRRYYDDAGTDPLKIYDLEGAVSAGLSIDESSAQVKVNGEVKEIDGTNIAFNVINLSSLPTNGNYDFDKIVGAHVSWYNSTTGFKYPEGSTIELTFSATIDEDASSKEFIRGVYAASSVSQEDLQPVLSEHEALSDNNKHQAIVLIDGNIVIRRVDSAGSPVVGAKYTIDGVKASYNSDDALYRYDEDGTIDTFVTNDDGAVILLGLPMGEYTVRETFSPTGNPPENPEMIATTYGNLTETTIKESYGLYKTPASTVDITNAVIEADNGQLLMSFDDAMRILGYGSEDTAATLTYNRSAKRYESGSGSGAIYVKKESAGYHLYYDGDGTVYGPAYDGVFVADSTLGRDMALITSAYLGMTLEVNGNTATTKERSIQDTLYYNEAEDCFTGEAYTSPAILCRVEDGYLFEGDLYHRGGAITGVVFRINSGTGAYHPSAIGAYVIDSVTDEQMVIKPYATIFQSEKTGYYYLDGGGNSGSMLVSHSSQKEYTAEFLFRDMALDDNGGDEGGPSKPANENGASATPEDVFTNPQTSDLIPVIASALTSAAVLSVASLRKLSRR